jgi:hypothetical protein
MRHAVSRSSGAIPGTPGPRGVASEAWRIGICQASDAYVFNEVAGALAPVDTRDYSGPELEHGTKGGLR